MSVFSSLTRIVQTAVEAESPAVQVNCIVDGIQQEMAVDVCSLYLRSERDELVLVASHGLDVRAVGKARLPAGRGLVGEVGASLHPVNVVEPAAHPAFELIPGSGEEQYHSFCAVPLVRRGAMIGVLAVQRLAPRAFSAEEEGFLVTLAAQLALVVANWDDWHLAADFSARTVTGLAGAPGIGVGAARLCEVPDLFSVSEHACASIDDELQGWRALLARVQAEVAAERDALDLGLSHEIAGIFNAYHMLLSDPVLTEGVAEGIRAGKSLPSALRATVQHFADLFLAMDDPYLRARHEDIRHLGNRLYASLLQSTDTKPLQTDGPVVLVGAHVSVSDIAAIPAEKLAGVVCFHGSLLSHTAVLASALGIPAVMAVGELKDVAEGETMLVDGHTGRVVLHPDALLCSEYERLRTDELAFNHQLAELRDAPAITRDGVRVELFANSGLTADIMPGLINGAEGLGLYRTEIPFMVRETFPSEDEQCALYSEVIAAYTDKPVYMRVLDVGSDKPLPYFPISEENPALGWRGIRFCLDNSPLLLTQIRAMLRAGVGHGNLNIILPMVSSFSELRDFHVLVTEAMAQLESEGVQTQRPRIGIMVEVPAAISQLPKWRELIDFVSIGSNDLSQYVLAVDRNNPRVAGRYDHLHPAVIAEIERIVSIARQLQLPVSLCGELSSDPHAVILMVALGMRRLSMSAARLPLVKWLLRAMDTREAKRVYDEALGAADADAVRAITTTYLTRLEYPGVVH